MSGGNFTDRDDVKIKGVDSGGVDRKITAEIDENGYWRLLVSSKSTISVIEKPHHFVKFLRNGGSKAMAVNGSVTPVVFSSGPPASKKWFVYELQVLISDLKVDSRLKFGDINGGAPNGVLCESFLSSTAREIFNLNDNSDTAVTFDYEFSSKSDSALANEDALFVGNLKFQNVIVLDGDNSDVIRTTVRDNLSGLDQLRMTIKAYEVI